MQFFYLSNYVTFFLNQSIKGIKYCKDKIVFTLKLYGIE